MTSEWQCEDDTCVMATERCDGHAQCADGSDEMGCGKWRCTLTCKKYNYGDFDCFKCYAK